MGMEKGRDSENNIKVRGCFSVQDEPMEPALDFKAMIISGKNCKKRGARVSTIALCNNSYYAENCPQKLGDIDGKQGWDSEENGRSPDGVGIPISSPTLRLKPSPHLSEENSHTLARATFSVFEMPTGECELQPEDRQWETAKIKG